MTIKNIAIYGVGLIGGSIGLTIKHKKLPYHITGIGRDSKKLNKALNIKAIDKKLSLPLNDPDLDKLSSVDLIIFAAPISKILPLLTEHIKYLKDSVIITDVSSVKGRAYIAIQQCIKSFNKKFNKNISYISSHPMAGKEEGGIINATNSLFNNSSVFIIKKKYTLNKNLSIVDDFWKKLGTKTCYVDYKTHDKIVANTSHLPHIISYAFSENIGNLKTKELKFGISNSFNDLTRISHSDPELWTEICLLNKIELLKSLSKLTKELNLIKNQLKTGNESKIKKIFTSANSKIKKLSVVK